VKAYGLPIVALAAVVLAAASVFTYATRPHHTTCLVVDSGGHQRLFFGSPGESSAHPTGCEFQFLSASSGAYVRFSSGRLNYVAKLTPLAQPGQITAANALPVTGGDTVRCHVAGGQAIAGGFFACSAGFWQLVPESDGVVARLQRGSTVTSYQLVPASLPSGAARIFW